MRSRGIHFSKELIGEIFEIKKLHLFLNLALIQTPIIFRALKKKYYGVSL
jgi:hypothetical protein